MPAAASHRSGVVVIGGANVDVRARSARRGPGHQQPRHGHPLRRRGRPQRRREPRPARYAGPARRRRRSRRPRRPAAGRDRAAGVGVAVVRTSRPTGTYVAVLDADGELVVAVSDMAGTDALLPDDVRRPRTRWPPPSSWCSTATSRRRPRRRLDLAAAAGTPVVLDPVSVPKAAARTRARGGRALLAVTPNLAELGALVDRRSVGRRRRPAAPAGRKHVWVRLGGDGSVLSTAGDGVRLAPVAGRSST